MNELGKVEFSCVEPGCNGNIVFGMFSLSDDDKVSCPECSNEYFFNQDLICKLKKFFDLISAVRDASEILGSTNVSIDVEGREVKIPYRLLLTRLNTVLTLHIGDKKIDFRYRVEPLRDSEQALMQN